LTCLCWIPIVNKCYHLSGWETIRLTGNKQSLLFNHTTVF